MADCLQCHVHAARIAATEAENARLRANVQLLESDDRNWLALLDERNALQARIQELEATAEVERRNAREVN